MAPGRFNDSDPPTSNTRGYGDRASNANAEDRILLKALQEFFVPLVQTVVKPTRVKAMDFKGPEAMNLITALKEFVSTIVGGTLRVEEAPRKIQIKKNDPRNRNAGDDVGTRFNEVVSLSKNTLSAASFDTQDERFRRKLLNGLQEHISNKMPIRLLLIEPHDSCLQISLIDRGAIYARLSNIATSTLIDSLNSREVDDKLIESIIESHTKYSILSHKWLRGTLGEITYDHWNKGLLDPESAGYQKLASFCRTAWNDYGITLAWMDTICINKESSSELDESIRSMYAWYERAEICIVYLSETSTIAEIPNDSWFTRGWTLQELIAPNRLKFYNSEWIRLAQDGDNDKRNRKILSSIELATTISTTQFENVSYTPLSCRMQWAAFREVTREEDMAYALMGIFNVSISIAYGEGADRAFLRLLEEIMKTTPSGALDLFNWAGEINKRMSKSSLLPSSPRYYLRRSTKVILQYIINPDPLVLTPRGIRIPVILMPGVPIDCSNSQSSNLFGNYGAIAEVSWPSQKKSTPTTYCLLHESISGHDEYPGWGNKPQLTFAVFNLQVRQATTSTKPGDPAIRLETTCIAVVLHCNEPAGKVTGIGKLPKMPTMEPVVFELKFSPYKKLAHSMFNGFHSNFHIRVDELASHDESKMHKGRRWGHNDSSDTFEHLDEQARGLQGLVVWCLGRMTSLVSSFS
ncbi:hypothetical protein BDN70DRAFT_925638 [Pholiota conissans]|uniref:Heterokaryon incompatibility domain-containing protein n=1 Tax=Pholiota conissans TaxID=109636 RepID=A0A9P6CMQ9_9AGAR|nr:hypothetical protein BDN70DRAFT_925638 [Pholiota conissans]